MNKSRVRKLKEEMYNNPRPVVKGVDEFRKVKKLYKAAPHTPLKIDLGKRHKNESLIDFRERRKKVNTQKRLRRKR